MTPEELRDAVNADPALVHRGRLVHGMLRLDIGEETWFLGIEAGRVAVAGKQPPAGAPVRLRLSASAAEWAAFWEPAPRPGHHDLMALLRRRTLTVEGDQHLFMAHLRYVKDVLAKGRTPRSAA